MDRRPQTTVNARCDASLLGRSTRLRSAPACLAALALLLAVAATGCSGSEGEAKSSASASSAVTTSTATQTAPATGQSDSTSTPSALASTTSTAAPGASTVGSSAASGVGAQANAICAQRNRELRAAGPAGRTPQQVAKVAAARVAIERAALAKLEPLSPPAAASSEWQAMLLATKATLRATERLVRVSASPASIERRIASVNRPAIALLINATHAGLKQCAAIPALPVR